MKISFYEQPRSKQVFAGTGHTLTRLFRPLFWSVGTFFPVGQGLSLLSASFRLVVIAELAWPTAAVSAAQASHLLLTGINKSLIWGNYENPTHYAIWFMFWHVAIIALIAEKPSFPELYGLFCCGSPQPEPLTSPTCLILWLPQDIHRLALRRSRPRLGCGVMDTGSQPCHQKKVFGYYKKLNSDLSIKSTHLKSSPLPPLTHSLWPPSTLECSYCLCNFLQEQGENLHQSLVHTGASVEWLTGNSTWW